MWKNVPTFDKYEAHPEGNIRNKRTKRLLKPNTSMSYYRVDLYDNFGKRKTQYIHRIIASTFLPKESGQTEVNHKDGNKQNNNMLNLEWVSSKENKQHANTNITKRRVLPVIQMDRNHLFIKEYPSLTDAHKHTGVDMSDISKVCKNKLKQAGGFYWKYKEPLVEADISTGIWKPLKGFNNRYLISRNGKVYSKYTSQFLSQCLSHGYYRVHINFEGACYSRFVHRLLAETFLENPENKTSVNHIDSCRTNNHVENLEWVSHKENMNNPQTCYKAMKSVCQIDPQSGDILRVFDSVDNAARYVGAKTSSSIINCCKGRTKTSHKYVWVYG